MVAIPSPGTARASDPPAAPRRSTTPTAPVALLVALAVLAALGGAAVGRAEPAAAFLPVEAASVAVPAQGATGTAGFNPIVPFRLADTRPGFTTSDGLQVGGGPTGELSVSLAGRAGIVAPLAVTVNVTVTEAVADAFVTVHPCGEPRPWASNLNVAGGGTVANLVTTKVGGSAICVFASSPAHLIVDLMAWYGPGDASITAASPARFADTRAGALTVDGAVAGGGARTSLSVPVAGRAPVPADATAVVVNATVTEPAAAGYLTVYPCGEAVPHASNLNFAAGQTVANLVVSRIGAGGAICVFSTTPTQVVLDVSAWAPAGSTMSSVSPRRLLDTRADGFTYDGRGAGVGRPRAGVTVDVPVSGRAGLPATPAAVWLNVTVTEADGPTYVTAYPCGRPVPPTSNLNVTPGRTAPNLVLVGLGAGGAVCLFTAAPAQLIVDVAGWIPGGPPPPVSPSSTVLAGCPVLPADNAWNADVSALPLRAESAAWVSSVGAANLHADFGSNPSYGIPFTVVAANEPLRPITFVAYGDESDPGPYPVPLDAPVEAGSDRHVLVLQQDTCRLYELYAASVAGAGWTAASGAVFDLRSNGLRPDRWTSADAAGLPILPGLVRYEEVRAGAITHALRFTVPATQNGFIHPATHAAGTTASAPPMGARFRLKASFDLSGYHGDALVVLTALKRYGMIVADNGTGWYLSGATDPRWNDEDLDQLKTVPGSAFEVVDTGPVLS